jgi:class 3 adenylate cyclase/transcriptional regulator with GAF, ATPase, and Fis domain
MRRVRLSYIDCVGGRPGQRRTGAAVKVRHRKATKLKRRKEPAATRGRGPSAADLQEQLDRLTRELVEAREQQAATSEVLQVISSSPGELEPVFQAMLEKAARICGAKVGSLAVYEVDLWRVVARHNAPRELAITLGNTPYRAHPQSAFGQVARTKKVVQLRDIAAGEPYAQRDPTHVAFVEIAGARTVLAVPMLKENDLKGAISIWRIEDQPFTDKQIELVESFAKQAVIAIENARLLNELRQRTDDLAESLQQQTATSDVLSVISSSPGNLQPVFATALSNATRLCGATFGVLYLREGDVFRVAAHHNAPAAYIEERRRNPLIRPIAGSALGRVVTTKQAAQIADVQAEPAYHSDPGRAALLKGAGARTLITVPMLKENELIGAIGIYRREVQPFSDKQIELVTNFAAQAVIAIENARLLNELRQRTADLREAHDRVTAQAADLETWNRTLERRVAEQVAEIGRVGRLKSFLPPQIAQLVVSAGHESVLESHRRDVSVVFCDLRGFTAFSELAEPEEVMLVLREYHTKLGVLINKFEGTVERFSGDGLLVVFNDPLPCPDASMRAVQMALEMRDEVAKLSVKWSHSGHDIGFGVGIAHGYATLGSVGYEGRLQYSVTGKVANLASRLCDQAKDGQILVDINVFSAVETLADVEFAGELALKGFSRPVKAFNVCNLRSSRRLRVV